MIKAIIEALKRWRLKQNFKTACKKADCLQAKTFKKQLVYLMDGRFVIVERQELKSLHRERKFKNGLNLREVEAAALYKTNLK